MGKIRNTWKKHWSAILYGGTAVIILAVLLPIHFSLAYQGESERNRKQLEALGRREDIRPEGFTFAVCGTSKDSRFVWEGTLRNLERDETAFSIHLGDGTHAPDLTSYAYYLRQLELLGKPLLMVPGESETGGASGTDLFRDIFGDPYYSFPAGNCYFIMLDDSGGEGIDGEQEAWLRGELEKSQAYKTRFVCLHYPLFDPEGSPPGAALKDAEAARRLQDLFGEYGVTMIFASHVRGIYQGTWGSTPYMVTGGGGAPIDDIDNDNRYYNFVKVSVYQDKVDYEVVKTPRPPSEGKDLWGYYYSLHSYSFFAVWFWWDLLLLLMVVVVIGTLVASVRRARSKPAPEGE